MARKLIHVFAVPSPAEVAGRIRAERERLGITQSDAARMLGIARGTYRQLEVEANPQLGTLFELVTRVGMDFKNIAPELFGKGGKR
jgi:DNA-binding XRE family transcriptional regulator